MGLAIAFLLDRSCAGDDGILMALDAEKELAEQRGEGQGDERDCDDCEASPDDEGVPLPVPELTCEGDGVGAG